MGWECNGIKNPNKSLEFMWNPLDWNPLQNPMEKFGVKIYLTIPISNPLNNQMKSAGNIDA